ncbi:MAG: pentapeptide repeat-containing protein [Bacteroidales bacterium]|nr:pentapeptide repeat-containing protein [Bacteroidales bacterium]
MTNFINSLLPSGVVEAFGWMILHSLWQGAVISVILGLMMIITRKFSAGSRYFIAITAMLFMPVTAVYTFFRYYTPAGSVMTVEAPMVRSEAVVTATNTQSEENRIRPVTLPAAEKRVSGRMRSYREYFYQHIPFIVTIWMLGMLVFALKFLGGLAYTQRLKHYRILPVSDEWQQVFDRLAKMLNLKKAVRILQSTLVTVPMVVGYFKPVVLIPVSAFTGLSPKQLEAVILHELAHIVRKDYIINILQSVVEIIFFYHPAVWWMSKMVRQEREHCCDDIAIEKSGDSVSFAKALANIQEQIFIRENIALALGRDSNHLFKRIKRLLNQPNMKTNFTEGFTASCIIFAGIFIMMLNTGSARFTAGDNMQSKTAQFINDVMGNADDTVKTAIPKESAGQGSAEDRLFELEQDRKAVDAGRRSVEEEKAGKEISKAETEAREREMEAKKAEKEAEKALIDAETEKREVEEEIIQGVEAGLEEMDIDAVVDEAMAGAEAGISGMDLNRIVREAVEGIRTGVKEIDAEIISEEILHGIEAAIYEIDLNVFASEIISGVRTALQEIDVNRIVQYHLQARPGQESFRGEPGQLDIISRGVGEWNQWRDDNPGIEPDLRGACLSDANLNSIDLHDALLDNIDLKEAVLDWANLEGASLRYAILKEATFNGARMMRADFSHADMKEVTLSGMLLRNTIFHGTNLKEADLSGADLRDSDLSNADLGEASLVKADLRGTNIRGADLSEAQLTGAKMQGAMIDDHTLLPPGFNPAAEGMVTGD